MADTLSVNAKMATVVGKILSNSKFREAFSKDAEGTLKKAGVTADASTLGKLKRISSGLDRRPDLGGSAITVSSIG